MAGLGCGVGICGEEGVVRMVGGAAKQWASRLLGGFAHKRAIFQFCELKRHFPGTIVLVTSCGFRHRETLSRVWEQFSF